ncbi:hypothetical protein GGG17_05120 [Arsenicicoccus sp. MKL-02]|uniref:Uncharacterized protein n=1 Tax=Arsenicicoccus cauae TaxID=2663847 RepID=A0A6I3IRQ2_9MICO|nr:hypothetical protein [Arsenicicoccus cauae]MTB71359.1 hypothetical protein [Arsenicicoccus cauae]
MARERSEAEWQALAVDRASALGVDAWTVAEAVHAGNKMPRAEVDAEGYWLPVLARIDALAAAVNEADEPG